MLNLLSERRRKMSEHRGTGSGMMNLSERRRKMSEH